MPARTAPLYPHYLPTRPEGYTPTIDVPAFEADERGLHADEAFPEIYGRQGGSISNLTSRIGTEIRGVQISQLSDGGLDELALLAARRGVLVFVSPRMRCMA